MRCAGFRQRGSRGMGLSLEIKHWPAVGGLHGGTGGAARAGAGRRGAAGSIGAAVDRGGGVGGRRGAPGMFQRGAQAAAVVKRVAGGGGGVARGVRGCGGVGAEV